MRREKTSLPVDVRRSKTSLLKFPNHERDDRSYSTIGSVADPDLQIGEGGRSSLPWDKGGGGVPVSKKIFSALRASLWSKSKGCPGPPGPSPGSATEGCCTLATKPYGFEHKCARNLSVQAVLTTSALLAFIAIANWAQQPYLFRTIQSIQTKLPSQRCYKIDFFITLIILKLPIN